MTTSNCFVYKWLPGATEPVVAGVLTFDDNNRQSFTYGRSYLDRSDAQPIYAAELALTKGTKTPIEGMLNFSCLRDASPDAWGRRVINARILSKNDTDQELDEITYLMHSASDRIGSLDFQASSSQYVPRETDTATLDELYQATEIVGRGEMITPDLDQALFHGSSIGGARPKAMITADNAKYIAKFSASNDTFEVVKAEYIAMRLATIAGINVADVMMEHVAGKDVLMVKRFDREKSAQGWCRRSVVSGLTILGLDEHWAREASYINLLNQIRLNSVDFKQDARELFARMVFNVLIGNTDDHARNHAFFVEGDKIRLTPAYDICPQNRSGGEASHGMKIWRNSNLSQLNLCVQAATDFDIGQAQAIAIIAAQIEVIVSQFSLVCDEINVPVITRKILWRRAILNPYIFGGGFEYLDVVGR